MEFIEEMDTGNITIAVGGSADKHREKPYFTSTDTLRTLANGYIDAIKEIHRHIEGTRRRIKWTRISQASKDMAQIWDRWTDSIDWWEVSQEVSDECLRTKDRWVQMGRLPLADDCSTAIQTARAHEYLLHQKEIPKDWIYPMTETERFWRHLRDDYQLAWTGDLHRKAFDDKSTIQLIDGFRRGLRDRHQTSANRRHKDWAETWEGAAVKAALSDKAAKHWQGPTRGATRQERELHRRQKRAITFFFFCKKSII
jgi:hypothetical protein